MGDEDRQFVFELDSIWVEFNRTTGVQEADFVELRDGVREP